MYEKLENGKTIYVSDHFHPGDFCPKSMILPQKISCPADTYVAGIDIGYSAVKISAPNKAASFPSAAARISSIRDRLGAAGETDIIVEDANGVWLVGDLAIHESTLNSSLSSHLNADQNIRERWGTPEMHAVMEAAYGLTLISNNCGSGPSGNAIAKQLYIHSGHPSDWKDESDKRQIREEFGKEMDFGIYIGNAPRQDYHFRLDSANKTENDRKNEHFRMMEQPKAALYSAVLKNDASFTEDASDVINATTIVEDPGYGTNDGIQISKGQIIKTSTDTDCSMRHILQKSIDDICEQYHPETQINLQLLQAHLSDGKLSIQKSCHFDDLGFPVIECEDVDFTRFLKEHASDAGSAALSGIIRQYKMTEVSYLIMTGGLGDYWYPLFKEKLSGFRHMKVISANRNNPSLSNVFSNARGYQLAYIAALKIAKTRKRG